MSVQDSKIGEHTIIVLDGKTRPEDVNVTSFTHVPFPQAMEGHAVNIQYADHATQVKDQERLVVAYLSSIFRNPLGYYILCGPHFIDSTMFCKIRSKRMVHRGYRSLLDQFPAESVGLHSLTPFMGPLLEI